MKKICLILSLTVLLSVMSYSNAFADDSAEINIFYDFEGYSSVGAFDAEWSKINNSGLFCGYVEDNGNYAMKLSKGAFSTLYLGQNISKGRLHISLDVKIVSDTMRLFVYGYDGRDNTDELTGESQLSHMLYINHTVPGDILYDQSSNAGESWVGYDRNKYSGEYDWKEWHRFDIITTDLSGTGAYADYYIDGIKMNSDDEKGTISSSKGLKGLCLQATEGSSNDYLLVDNVSIHRFMNSNGLGGTIEQKKVATNNGEVNIRLTDIVDEPDIKEENISITHKASGKQLSNFYVDNVTKNSFSIKFEGEIATGTYNIALKEQIRGKITGLPMTELLTFKTEYKEESFVTELHNENFNSYQVEQGTLPEGWNVAEGSTADYAISSVGKTGEEADFSLGVVNAPRGNTENRFIRKFKNPIPAGSDYEISFDVYSKQSGWYLSLYNEDETDAAMNNISLAMRFYSSGRLDYSSTGSSGNMTEVDDAISVIPNEWNNIKLKVKPLSEEQTQYIISVNGSDEYTVLSDRNFLTKATTALGFGYTAAKAENTFCIDNIRIESKIVAVYPEVDSVNVLRYDGTAVNTSIPVTPEISAVEIVFNTVVDENSALECIRFFEGENELDYDYSVEIVGGISIFRILFNETLMTMQNYRVEIKNGIVSASLNTIASEFSTKIEFTTQNYSGCKIFKNGYDGDGVYRFAISKSDDSSGEVILAICSYEEETVGDTVYKEFVAMEYIPIIISAESTGIFEWNIPLENPGEYVQGYLWTYPDFLKLSVESDGEINF